MSHKMLRRFIILSVRIRLLSPNYFSKINKLIVIIQTKYY